MTGFATNAWWLLLLGEVTLIILVWSVLAQLTDLRTMAGAGRMSRSELEQKFAKGSISRDEYERLKERAR